MAELKTGRGFDRLRGLDDGREKLSVLGDPTCEHCGQAVPMPEKGIDHCGCGMLSVHAPFRVPAGTAAKLLDDAPRYTPDKEKPIGVTEHGDLVYALTDPEGAPDA